MKQRKTLLIITTLLLFGSGVHFQAISRPQLTFTTIGSQAVDSASHRLGTSGVLFHGGGVGIDQKSDNLIYTYGTVSGNFEVTAYCAVISDARHRTETGLLVRSGLTPDAACIAILIRDEQGMVIKYRTADGKGQKETLASVNVHNYVKIRRAGKSFSIYSKATSSGTWVQVGSAISLTMPSALKVGVCHSSADNGRITTSQFNEITGLPEEKTGGSTCNPLQYNFNSGVPLTTLGFREITKWSLDTGKFIRSDIPVDSVALAHIVTPAFAVGVGTDTVTVSWNFSFTGDTTSCLYDYGIYSTQTMNLNHRAKITAPKIGCNGKIITGTDDTLYTNLFSADSTVLFDRTKVYGNVTTGTGYRLINGAAIYGTVATRTFLPPVLPNYNVVPGTLSRKVNVNDSLDLIPGNYDTLLVYANAKVRFRSGIYQIAKMIVNPDVKLYFETDSTKRISVRVRDILQIADRVTMVMSGQVLARKNVEVYTHQSTKLDVGANVRIYGYLIAPNAEVHLVSRGTIIDGGVYAAKISCEPDVVVTVNAAGLTNDWLTTQLKPKNSAQNTYSIAFAAHRSTMQDTMTDIVIRSNTTTIASFRTGQPTPLNKTLTATLSLFRKNATNRLRLLFNNGTGAIPVVDTLPFNIDTLSSLTFDFDKRTLLRPMGATVDNISLSCVADSCPPVVIVTQPGDTSVYESESVTFTCDATAGANVPMYQWYRGTTPIPLANLPSYSITSVNLSDDGAVFSCNITGACGVATTRSAILRVYACELPRIIAQPDNDTAALNSTASFTVNADGYELQYRWKRNDDYIDGATGRTFTISPVQPFNNLDRFRAVVRNGCGMETQTRDALLVVPDVGPCKITSEPYGDTLVEGDYYHTNIVTVCNGGSFEWYRNGLPVSGSGTAKLIYGPVTINDNNSDFYCVVTNGITTDTSRVVRLIVRTVASMGGSISISGQLYRGDGNFVGSNNPEQYDFTAMLYTRKTGGEPVYSEKFRNSRSVTVTKGDFTLTLGRGSSKYNLQKIVAGHKDLYAELYAGKNGGMEIIAPRLHLTAAPYAFTAGVKVIYGTGTPTETSVSAPIGTIYVDRTNGDATWKLTKLGWKQID